MIVICAVAVASFLAGLVSVFVPVENVLWIPFSMVVAGIVAYIVAAYFFDPAALPWRPRKRQAAKKS